MESHSSDPQTLVFEDVVIRFTRQIYYADEHVYQLEVRRTPSPLPGGAFRTDVEEQLTEFRRIFVQRVAINQFFYRYDVPAPQLGSAEDLADLGRRLYELLPESFRQAFPGLVQDVLERGKGLRLVLEAQAGDEADRLLSLPWEILFFRDTRVFLARSPRLSIVRRLLDAARRSPARMKPVYNVLHVIAHNPADPAEYQIDEGLQQTERVGMRQAIAPGRYRAVEKPGSVEQMTAALREDRYHIVHFLGHGEVYRFEAVDGEGGVEHGYLRFVGTEGTPQWVTGEQLEHLLHFAPTVQLVVLNACGGGAGDNAAGNVALELVYSGLPYVVAMQSDVLQDTAKHFIDAFYAEIQSGRPVEHAVAVGRAAIAANSPQTIDWCLPVLYTNVGLAERPPIDELAEQMGRWVSLPKAKAWLGVFNLSLGISHLVVSTLLFSSGVRLALPEMRFVNWVTGGLALVPFLVMAILYLSGRTSAPRDWPLPTKLALAARTLGSASMGLGLPAMYTWFLLMLLVSLGFWELLSSVARLVLLGLVFVPSILLSCVFSYSQAAGHGRAFVSEAQVERPVFEWGELAIVAGGYIILSLPCAALTLWSDFLALPRGGFLLGVLLVGLGYMLYADRD